MEKRDGTGRRIFVVDDNPDNLGVAAEYLKKAGYKIAVAPNGRIALERAARIRPVVILLDIKMPGIDGFEVCRKLKKNAETADIPVIFLTALNDIGSITEGFRAGGSDYLSKPFNKDELLARVLTQTENYLYKNRLKQEVRLRTAELESSNQLLKAEINRRKGTEGDLRHLKDYLSNIINSMPSVIVGVDRECRVTQWNMTVAGATGIDADAARGIPLADLLPQMAPQVSIIKKSIRTGEICRDLQKRRITETGVCYEDVIIYPLITDGAEGAVIRIDDVTEKVRMEEMMIQSEKMLSVGGLAAGMAHEINNPLAGMMQTASVLSNRLGNSLHIPANKKAAEAAGTTLESIEDFMAARGIPRMLSTITESGKRVAEIVGNMLTFARKDEAIVSSHTLDALLDRTLDLAATDYDLKKKYDFRQIKIIREYAENLPVVPCESAKIQQVLLNIFGNGAQAMQMEGTENPRFTLRTYLDEGHRMACMEIEDNGPGMDKATCKRVFEPFFTTKPVGVGTGLGLSVSFFIITENHNGEMAVESRPGHGAKFIIRLPVIGKKI